MKRHLKDFTRAQVYQIADEYARSPYDITAAYFAKEHSTTESVIYSILKKACIESIIPLSTVKLISKKSSHNAYHNGGEGGMWLSIENYRGYLEKRRVFQFPKKIAKWYAEDYASSPLNQFDYAKVNYMTTTLLSRTLKQVIEKNWVNDECVMKLRVKSLQFYSQEVVTPFYNELIFTRNKNKELQKVKKRKK